MAFGKQIDGPGIISGIQEALKGSVSNALQGANAGTAYGEVELKVSFDYSQAEKQHEEALKRLGSASPLSGTQSILGDPGAGSAPAPGLPPMSADTIPRLVSALEKLTEKIDGASGGGTGGGGGGEADGVGPDAPSPVGGGGGKSGGGLFGNRGSMHAWEVQRAMNDPLGFAKQAVMGKWLAKAGRLAMMDAGAAMGEIGLVGSVGLAGAALAGGFAIGDHLNDGTRSAGEKEIEKRVRDASLSYASGVDFRGATFGANRLQPGSVPENFNFAYARRGLDALGVNLGDMEAGDAARMPFFMSSAYRRANRLGVNQEALAGFLGQSWASGATDKSVAGSEALLKRIEEAIHAGNRIGIRGNETLQAMAGVMQLEESRSGAVGASAMASLSGLLGDLGSIDKHLFGGRKSQDVVTALGTNQDKTFKGMAMRRLLGADGKLTAEGRSLWTQQPGHEAMDGAEDYEKMEVLLDSPAVNAMFAQDFASGELSGLPAPLRRMILGLGGVAKGKALAFMQNPRGIKRAGGTGPVLAGGPLSGEADESESMAAFGGQRQEIAGTAADAGRLRGLLEYEQKKAEAMLKMSEVYNNGVTAFGSYVGSFGESASKMDRAVGALTLAMPGAAPGGILYHYLKNQGTFSKQ